MEIYYKKVIEDFGISDESLDLIFAHAKIQCYKHTNELVNDKFYGGTEKYVFDAYKNMIEQRILFLQTHPRRPDECFNFSMLPTKPMLFSHIKNPIVYINGTV